MVHQPENYRLTPKVCSGFSECQDTNQHHEDLVALMASFVLFPEKGIIDVAAAVTYCVSSVSSLMLDYCQIIKYLELGDCT